MSENLLIFFCFFLVFDLSFLTLEFFFNSFVCTLENTNSLSLVKEILSTYAERKKIHECSSRGEGKKDEDKERKE